MNGADTAWVLICAGLVLFMTPGLALFYGGMVPVRNVLTMMMQNIIPLGVISLTWVLVGYTLAFSNQGNSLVGEFDAFALIDVDTPQFHTVAAGVTIPALAFVAYQMMFAIITPALLTGATAGRLRFAGWVVFLAAWSILVYPQVARWLWHPKGWLAQLGAQDWAGGIVVHSSAGAAAVAVLLVVGRRRGWPNLKTSPNNLPLMLVGAGILWFGWFGFNAGDGLQANDVAAQALMNTHIAGSAAMLTWLVVERLRDGHSTLVGAVSGAVAGLATITPCAGFVGTGAALLIGLIAGLVCALAVQLKRLLRYDDALDVIAVHFVGGVLGSVLLGFFGDNSVNPAGVDGVFSGGGGNLLWHQVVAIVCVVLFSFVLSWIIAAVISRTMGLREPGPEQEDLDRVQQGASGYSLSGITTRPTTAGRAAANGGNAVDARKSVPNHLVSAVVSTDRIDGLRDALLMAGARSLELSDAAVYTGKVRTEAFRSEKRRIDFADRMRVQAAVDEEHEEAVVAVLKRFGAEPDSIYRLAITPY
ncbi:MULTISPECIES: ammonium transporter [unclassified Arthrobacter]|uniref:ammonium transporter n=1 Tax=unclassified Arthrobacter TaxID=235627 RepID=UPI001D137FC7|nr:MULTISPECIES: ammonium transporter [unclassified Arthrobacter]MCC3278000.1 ammonium transporter [Arthrobacter sp. zg-Y40]MCC9176398.1 ammonium transporter [Arthrobacter sp. zg-Y750]MCC3276017.1 ammonium transporter [Arthrobacter sp. zg-Y20]MDK1316174.1 ammonium transporter [Arthrobacter sp. zg.Y20]MDK1326900.1 ammonium transporter [Arthrobacter sp. zg-Y1143]